MPCGNICGELRIPLLLFQGTVTTISRAATEGTYLVWIDCRASGISSDVVALRLQEQQHLMVNSGTMYGPGGEGFIRLNIACPRALLADGLERMARLFYREVF